MRVALRALLLALPGLVKSSAIYFSPSVSSFATDGPVSTQDAGLALSHFLGLEQHVALGDNVSGFVASFVGSSGEQPLVAQTAKSALLITLSEDDAHAVLPHDLSPTAELDAPPVESLDGLVATYLAQAAHSYSLLSSVSSDSSTPPRFLDIFSVPSPVNDQVLRELTLLVNFVEGDTTEPRFGALELGGLKKLAEEQGRTSEAYVLAASATEAAIRRATLNNGLRVALVTFSATGDKALRAEEAQPPAQSPLPPGNSPRPPLSSSAKCYANVEACGNATTSCGGHGTCVAGARAGKICYNCACGVTKDAQNRTMRWAGEKCERKDISGPFTLITGTVIALILFIGASVALLMSVGDAELPNTLTGGAPVSRRD